MTENAKAQSPRPSRSHWLRWGVAFFVLILILLAWHLIGGTPPAKGAPPQVVKVAQATLGEMPVVLNELGTVAPVATVTVLPNQQVSGYLIDVPFHEGQDIKKDQLLAQIDPRPFEVQKLQAEGQLAKDRASLAQARSDLARFALLHSQQSIAEQTYYDQRYLVKQLEAAVKIDKANIAQFALDIYYCHITAPVGGRVGLRLVDQGNFITGSSSSGVAVITTMKPTTVEFTVAQNDLGKVVERFNVPGAKLEVTAFNSDNTRKLGTGTLFALSNQMATSTGTVTLRASFPNNDEALFPNEFVNVQLLVDTLTNAVLVPTPAVLTGAPGSYVYLVNKNGTVSVHKVTPGPSDGRNTVITSGLKVGDTVVTQGTDRLSDGTHIKVANPAEHHGEERRHVPSPGR